MKHWKLREAFCLAPKRYETDDFTNIFYVYPDKEVVGNVIFEEGCDNYFNVSLPESKAIEILEELIEVLKEV